MEENNPTLLPDLRETSLHGFHLIGADLSGAILALANLQGANLTKAKLSGAHLETADLNKANLTQADLSEANLTQATLCGADLTLADLDFADLNHSDLKKANLASTSIILALFQSTDLQGVNVAKARFGGTIFAEVDLSEVEGLEDVEHLGPSTIGIDTLYLSKGKIPELFLRGAGVPEQLITYARSLVGSAIEFYSCFISYSSQDGAFAERLHADLVARNLRCWFAPEDLKIGDRFQERIEESIRLFDKVMIVLSEASVQSAWVEREVNAAREREDREKRTVLFPIRIDDAVMDAKQPWAADIRRSRHIGDFCTWETHSSYVKALDRLLRDLKATNTTEP